MFVTALLCAVCY